MSIHYILEVKNFNMELFVESKKYFGKADKKHFRNDN